jgi:hypothetical protein
MNPKFLKRLKRFGAHYPQGPGELARLLRQEKKPKETAQRLGNRPRGRTSARVKVVFGSKFRRPTE